MKLPVGCETLAGLRPVQLIGGEQTLFIVTGDGRVSVIIDVYAHVHIHRVINMQYLF